MDRRETETTSIWLDEAGFVRVTFKGTANTGATAEKTLMEIADLTGGHPTPVLFDTASFGPAEPESWVRFIEGIGDVASAAAVVVGEHLRGRYGGFMQAINSMLIPFEAFDTEDEAVAFLTRFLGR